MFINVYLPNYTSELREDINILKYFDSLINDKQSFYSSMHSIRLMTLLKYTIDNRKGEMRNRLIDLLTDS